MRDTARRKPYIVRITCGWEYKDGKAKQIRKVLGSYKTRSEAMKALTEYLDNPYDLSEKQLSMSDLYSRWSESHFKEISGSKARTYKSAWNYCSGIYEINVRDFRQKHLRILIDNASLITDGEKKSATGNIKKEIRSMLNQMLNYAVEYDIIQVNPIQGYTMPKSVTKEIAESATSHISFSKEERSVLWSNTENTVIRWILIQCYMGWRPQELCELKIDNVDLNARIITGGMKTIAGKDRIVPIHDKIFGLVSDFYTHSVAKGSKYLINSEAGHVTYNSYSYRFRTALSSVGISGHSPHDPRKTFSTMAKEVHMDENALKRMMGHQISDITERVYTDRTVDWLKNELSKLQ